MRKEKFRTATLILGIILAGAVAFSQFITTECVSSVKKAATEQSDNASDEESTFISLPTFSLPVPVSVQANLDAYCLFEILLEDDADEDYVEEQVFRVDRFFATMFRVIISPNAP